MKTALYELLTELEEYFDQRADMREPTVDNQSPPNDEAIFLDRVQKELRAETGDEEE